MKRFICMGITLILLFSLAIAENIDLSNMTNEELKTLKKTIDTELLHRTYSSPNVTEDTIIGMWYLNTITIDGQMVDVSETGVEMSLEIKSDMTCTLNTNGNNQSGIWSKEDDHYLVLGGDGFLADSKLQVLIERYQMVFSRTPVNMSIPEAVVALGEDDFFGEWVLDKVGQNGIVVPKSIASGNTGIDISMSIKPGEVTFYWFDFDLSVVYDSQFINGQLILTSSNNDDPEINFSPIQITSKGGIMTTVSVSNDAEPFVLYMKRDPFFEGREPIPSFGLNIWMNRYQIILTMKRHGLILFEEDYKEINGKIEGSFWFYGKAEVFDKEVTAVKVEFTSSKVEYCYYFFDEEAAFRNRLPVDEAKWYQVGELEGVYEYLYQSLKKEFGDPGDYKTYWKIDATHYSLSNGSETDHMVFLSVF